METLIESKQNVVLRRINIGKWSSPVAQQHAIRGLPGLVVYDGQKLVTRDLRAAVMHIQRTP